MLKGITERGSILLRTQSSLDGADFTTLNTWLSGLDRLHSLLALYKAISTGGLTRTSNMTQCEDEFARCSTLNEYQRIIPFLVKSFYLALEIIKGSPITDQYVMLKLIDGLTLPIRILSMIGSSSSWLIQCILKTAKLISDQTHKRRLWDSGENKYMLTRPLMISDGFSFLSAIDWIAEDIVSFGEGDGQAV